MSSSHSTSRDINSTPLVRKGRQAARTHPAEVDPVRMGQRLRQLRKEAGLTLRQLSDQTGVSLPTLSKMELGQVSASYDKLAAVANALGGDIAHLFKTQGTTQKRSSVVAHSLLTDAPLYTTDHYEHRMLGIAYPGKTMTPVHGKIYSRSLDEFTCYGHHQGEEFIQVLSGTVRICFENGGHLDLQPTESAYFDSSVGHVYLSLGIPPAEVLIVMTPGTT